MMGRAAIAMASDLIEPLGTPEFFEELYRTCQSVLDNDQCNIFHFPPTGNPACLFTTATDARMRKITRACGSQYLSGGFRRDPVMKAAGFTSQYKDRPFLYHLRANDISDATYRRSYYADAEVREKLSLAFYAAAGVFYLSFYRNHEQDGYDQADIVSLSEMGGLVCRLVAKHYMLTAPGAGLQTEAFDGSSERYATLIRVIRQALLADPAKLTEKEAEICAAIACGMTSEGIALEHGISINTVATHRKRAYAKLQVSSQNELFARFYSQAGRFALANTDRKPF